MHRRLFQANDLAAGAAGAPAAAAALPKIHIGVKVKSHTGEVNLDFFSFCHKVFIDNKLKSFNFKRIICIFKLIQSHCKRWAASAAGVKKNSNGGRFFPLEVIVDLRFSRISQFNHCNTLLNI